MGFYLEFCYNSSGKSYPVYDIDKGLVGTLYNRESYILYGGEGCLDGIYFLGPEGYLKQATINTAEHPIEYTNCTDKPYGRVIIDGVNYYTFIMRKSKKIYKGDGTLWGTIGANKLVATNNPTVGSNHIDWKEISYMQDSNNTWIKVTGAGYNHGFVDTGIATASGHTVIPFYGSW